jgi:N-sulfoglucosamine sulfohydrolase
MVGEVPTLPQLLRTEGYRTGLIGKLHVLPEAAFPFHFRFDDKEVVSFQHRDVKRVAEEASKFMAAGESPFCLTVCYADAHLPFLRQDLGLPENPISAAAVKTLPAVGIDNPRLREQTADYYNCISRLDTGIGFLLDGLERSGKARNTLVIYVSDHGPQFGRGKVTSYELGLRVPLIIREPNRTEAGASRSELTSTIDLLPTILDYAGVRAPKNLPGKSLAPLMTGPDPEFRRHQFAEWNTSHAWPTPSLMFPQRSATDGRYKLIRNLLVETPNPVEEYYTTQALVQTGATQDEISVASEHVREGYATWRQAPPVELYDLFVDPYELDNLAEHEDYVQVRRGLINALEQWRLDTNDPLLDAAKLQMLMDEDRLGRPRPRENGATTSGRTRNICSERRPHSRSAYRRNRKASRAESQSLPPRPATSCPTPCSVFPTEYGRRRRDCSGRKDCRPGSRVEPDSRFASIRCRSPRFRFHSLRKCRSCRAERRARE